MPQTGEAEGRGDEGSETTGKVGESGAETTEAGGGTREEEIEWAENRVREMEMEEARADGKKGEDAASTGMPEGSKEEIGEKVEAEERKRAMKQGGEWGAEHYVDGQKGTHPSVATLEANVTEVANRLTHGVCYSRSEKGEQAAAKKTERMRGSDERRTNSGKVGMYMRLTWVAMLAVAAGVSGDSGDKNMSYRERTEEVV